MIDSERPGENPTDEELDVEGPNESGQPSSADELSEDEES